MVENVFPRVTVTRFAVEPLEAGRLVGHVALFGADWTTKVAEIHYWTAPWARGKGYAAEAANAVARWALLETDMARISLHVAVENAASRHVAEAAGFQFEGVLRSAAPTREW
jgi:RimJ/RimL family protein N-acetyltransferase